MPKLTWFVILNVRNQILAVFGSALEDMARAHLAEMRRGAASLGPHVDPNIIRLGTIEQTKRPRVASSGAGLSKSQLRTWVQLDPPAIRTIKPPVLAPPGPVEPEPNAAKSYAAEVIADSSGKWTGNQLRFATYAEADAYARDLYSRWTLVSQFRVVESTDPVNYEFGRDGLKQVLS